MNIKANMQMPKYGSPALQNIRGPQKDKKSALEEALNKKTKKPAGAIKQYGDKGYKPSNGIGVGM